MAERWMKSLATVGALIFLAGCSSANYSAMEQFGVHKRDILVDRVRKPATPRKKPRNSSVQRWSSSPAC